VVAVTVVVELTDSEYLHALIAGSLRRANARAKGRQQYYMARTADSELLDIIGSVGECCVAKYQNVFWCGAGEFRGDDVGHLQVRATTYDNGHLGITKSDEDDKPYVLVCVCNGVGKIRGWVYGREGKQERYWTNKSNRVPQFYVPQSDLRPIETLPLSTF
jgi:hypothetical protein